jgi:hypothetical protein
VPAHDVTVDLPGGGCAVAALLTVPLELREDGVDGTGEQR